MRLSGCVCEGSETMKVMRSFIVMVGVCLVFGEF